MRRRTSANAGKRGVKSSPLAVIDLFAGIGGLALGFLEASSSGQADFDVRLLVDKDIEARETFKRNYPAIPYLVADIAQCSGAALRERVGLGARDELHILVGGPPCQAFSRVGKRVLADPRNALVLDFLRLVKDLRPLVVLMENVPLIMTAFDGVVIEEINEALSELGYSATAEIATASDYGVPQFRKRALVVAYRNDLGVVPAFPAATHRKIDYAARLPQRKKTTCHNGLSEFISVEDAISDLPPLSAGGGEECAFYTTPPRTEYQRWAREGSIGIFNHRVRGHSEEYLKKISVIKEGCRNASLGDDERFSDNYFSQAYGRLHRRGIAHTITANFSNPGSGRFLHYRDLRAITVREAARFQSFRDKFVFHGFHLTQMRHVGNAVPVLLAREFALKIAADVREAGVQNVRRNGRPKSGWKETPELRSRIMRAVHGKNTGAELKLRQALSKLGVRGYRLHPTKVPGCPDVYFPSQKLAVFIDGCFWHGCPKCYRAPKSRKKYWALKVKRNKDRDAENRARCAQLGIRVVRVWEHDINTRCAMVAQQIAKKLAQNGKKR
ncbi:MAG: DNA mismatch endonuclease Vsr [Planctomycetia bacterium]|nr:DNA mismatch endonuclease Vsr [Planctomycetia bacterium]